MQIRQRIENLADQFTPAERKLASVLLADYPFAGLEPIGELSQRSHVSAPSISRFVNKLGCTGFQEFQQRLVGELKEGSRSPIHLREDHTIDRDTLLTSYFEKIHKLNDELTERVTGVQLDRICDMLGDPKRRIYMIGGRMTDSIAVFFVRHLQQIRKGVLHIPSDQELWPQYLLQMRPLDVVLIIDFRRYQASLATLAQRVRAQKAQTIVITDQWISPAAKGASELISAPIESGTLWDSYVPAFGLIEALLVPLAERNWDHTRIRIEEWDRLRAEPDPAEAE